MNAFSARTSPPPFNFFLIEKVQLDFTLNHCRL